MIAEVKFVTQGVSSLERSLQFYQDAFGFVERGRMEIAGPAFQAAWRMPADLTGEGVVLGLPAGTSGLLRLVEFNQVGQSIRGSYALNEDFGYLAVQYNYRDVESG